ncbi:MAG: metalloregulator ArsR/SmtB family transcription factor [Patescibacteria group bacterium]
MLSKEEIKKNRDRFNGEDKSTVATFKALSDINRYRIFRILIDYPKLTIGDIAQILDISLPLASQHLKILVLNNLIQKERSGKRILTRLERKNPFVQAIIKAIKIILKLNRYEQ